MATIEITLPADWYRELAAVSWGFYRKWQPEMVIEHLLRAHLSEMCEVMTLKLHKDRDEYKMKLDAKSAIAFMVIWTMFIKTSSGSLANLAVTHVLAQIDKANKAAKARELASTDDMKWLGFDEPP